ncbi:hypothetical protein DR66_2790 [Delftia acidovorans]|jgi:hypothetical protein|nr:hypothetical protein DR66_2790 [Delftia acidovorans]
MKFYHVIDSHGHLVISGTYQHDSELRFYRETHGNRLRVGLPKGYAPNEAPSRDHRWSVPKRCWVAPALDLEQEWEKVRYTRARLLSACDWVTLRAQETGEPVPAPWMAYRQALRDITDQPDPLAIVWPTPPA